MFYECVPIQQVSYPPYGCRPPELYKYPEVNPPVKLLFLGWNPPKPFGGFWSMKYDDSLRKNLHGILKELGQINAVSPNQSFLDEFLQNGFYFIHTVKCWTEAEFPRLGRGSEGEALINSCVRTHLEEELNALEPQKVCAFGKLPFLGLCKLFGGLTKTKATPTQGQVFQREQYGIPWPLLYTCFPQQRKIRVPGTEYYEPASEIAFNHLQGFL